MPLALDSEGAHDSEMSGPSGTWKDSIRVRLDTDIGANSARPVLDTLSAFDDAEGPVPDDLPWTALCAWTDCALSELHDTLIMRLSQEVDADQAAMFGRRFFALETFLKDRSETYIEARAYRIGLAVRATGILMHGERIATRIRALVDYLFSYGALLDYRQSEGALSIEALARSAQFSDAGAGLQHALVKGMTTHGPAHVNVLIVHKRPLQCIDARGAADLVDVVRERGAQAGISGGFFLYSEPDIHAPSRRGDPVGGLVDDGIVVGAPIYSRGAVWQAASGAYGVGIMGPIGWSVVDSRGTTIQITAVNPPKLCEGALYNRAYGSSSPPGYRSIAVVGTDIVGQASTRLPIPLAGAVLLPPANTPRLSGPLRWICPKHQPIQAAMMGGPMLRTGGDLECDYISEHFAGTAPPLTFSQDETFDQNLLPRMGVGLREDGALVFAAVDGRNLTHALGFTLQMTGRFLAALGCTHITNLDGGSSKRMVVRGQQVDLSTTELHVRDDARVSLRRMHSAILIG